MSIWTSISILIIVLSILILIIMGMTSYKKIKPTLKAFKNLNNRLDRELEFYHKEINDLENKVETINHDLNAMQKELAVKSLNFQNFLDHQDSLQHSMLYLQNHASSYSKGIASNLKEELKADGPKIVKVFKRTFKKTFKKQKERHNMIKKVE